MNGIRAYQNSLPALTPTRPASRVQAPQSAEQQPRQQHAAEALPQGVSRAEQQMIDRFFPQGEAVAFKLYGPGSANVQPQRLGGLLDLKG
ncbi:MAG: hypothetical protein RhofKO_38450 [Rhodothermales bacterium]